MSQTNCAYCRKAIDGVIHPQGAVSLGVVCNSECQRMLASRQKQQDSCRPCASRRPCTGCGRDLNTIDESSIYHMPLDWDPYCSRSCADSHSKRLSTAWM